MSRLRSSIFQRESFGEAAVIGAGRRRGGGPSAVNHRVKVQTRDPPPPMSSTAPLPSTSVHHSQGKAGGASNSSRKSLRSSESEIKWEEGTEKNWVFVSKAGESEDFRELQHPGWTSSNRTTNRSPKRSQHGRLTTRGLWVRFLGFLGGLSCVAFACSPCVFKGSLRVLRLPPAAKQWACEVN